MIMQITEEILNKNGYIVKNTTFPFNITPLYENENDVYIIDMGDDFNPRWLFGLSSDHKKDSEGNTLEDFNNYLKSVNKDTINI